MSANDFETKVIDEEAVARVEPRDVDEVIAEIGEISDALLDVFERSLASIHRRALEAAHEFQVRSQRITRSEQIEKNEMTEIRPYVRRRPTGRVEMAWYRLRFEKSPAAQAEGKKSSSGRNWRSYTVSTTNGPQKMRVFFDFLPRGEKSMRYSDAAFGKQPQWAALLIRETEDRFELLRKEQAQLGLMHRRLGELMKVREKFIRVLEDAE